MKDFAIEWYKERAKQPKYQSQVNESNLANIIDQINRAEYASTGSTCRYVYKQYIASI